MKIYIIAAVSADGFIAKSKEEFIDWTSKEDKKFFRDKTQNSGVIVLGGNTYRTLKSLLSNRRHIVYSRTKIDHPDVETTTESPSNLVKRLSKDGINEVAICGGSSIYSMFLEAGLVTDVYLTIEPLFFGQGVKLVNSKLDIKLNLHDVNKLNDNTLLLHYKI